MYPLTHGNDSFDGRPNDKPERKDLNQQQIDSLELNSIRILICTYLQSVSYVSCIIQLGKHVFVTGWVENVVYTYQPSMSYVSCIM